MEILLCLRSQAIRFHGFLKNTHVNYWGHSKNSFTIK